jgi:hypothetical protein
VVVVVLVMHITSLIPACEIQQCHWALAKGCCSSAARCLQSRYLNSQTYMTKRSRDRWTAGDTDMFYKGLAVFGTDFTAIAKLFPGRDR